LRQAAAAFSGALALPALGSALLLRPRWRKGLRERLGESLPGGEGGVWVHAASVGEGRAALRLVERLEARGIPVHTSSTTLAGREALRRSRPDLSCQLAPLDHPWCVGAALSRVAPVALVMIEAELWPSWIAAAYRRGVPVLLVSARMSERSFARYRRLAPVVKPTLARLFAVGARTPADAERFLALGVSPEQVSITGDLKLEADEEPPGLAPELECVLGGRPLIVAGSTHAGEEAAALDALTLLERAGFVPQLALAPRHLERVDEVLRLLRRRGRPWRRRTRLGEAALDPAEVLVLDSIGDLAGLYAHAQVGGHNVLEPASVGCPVIVGPHVEKISHALRLLASCGAARTASDTAGLAECMRVWLSDSEAALRAGSEGRRVLLAHRGSAERSASLVASVPRSE
jgi:3-deoxy-D-manno-octulosonic-acid transferase